MSTSIVFPAEWNQQMAVQLTWPHIDSDWGYLIEEVEKCFVNLAEAIALRQHLIIVCKDIDLIKSQVGAKYHNNISFFEIESNDTWARDHGGITIYDNGKPVIYDFCFNGWGMKFAACHDNQITRKLFKAGAFPEYGYSNMNFFVFEGGSIESDGQGTLLTTEECLLSPNRNDSLSKQEIEGCLKQFFGAERVLWLKNGYLAGDDTDSHIDTLARFCSPDTIAYVKCTDENDEHFDALAKMEAELKMFTQANDEPYQLVALPMATPVFDPDDGHRLPATYANFLIVNGAVLFPIYNCETDKEAMDAIKVAFPDRDIVPIDCSVLIRQHGSLHCVTMQYPASLGSKIK
ncbi:MAG: agmatine deiminase family protein [Bacteroidales bacterium]|nr:agmatine deiminase family protein [Bacteroidales bacterium]